MYVFKKNITDNQSIMIDKPKLAPYGIIRVDLSFLSWETSSQISMAVNEYKTKSMLVSRRGISIHASTQQPFTLPN